MPRVYLDIDFLVEMEKRYKPLTRVVSNYVGEWLFVVSSQVIREVFILNPNVALLEKIDLRKF